MDIFTFTKETDGLENSLNFAMKYGLLPDKEPRDCLTCGKNRSLKWTMNIKSSTANIPVTFVCSNKECNTVITLDRSTFFHDLKFPLSKALRLIYLWLLKASVQDCANQVEMGEDTVLEWFQFLREICAFIVINYTEAVGGPGQVVELCEYQLQTNKDSHDLWVLTGIDRTNGNNFAVHVENIDCETIWPAIKNYILPGSIVVTPRVKEFVKQETIKSNERLIFIHPKNNRRRQGHLHLDDMCSDLKQLIGKQMSSNQLNCFELYVYEYLYFKRNNFCNKPTSELILKFLNDVKLVYPGFKMKIPLKYS